MGPGATWGFCDMSQLSFEEETTAPHGLMVVGSKGETGGGLEVK